MTTREKTHSLAQEAGLSVKFMTVSEIEALARFHILVIAEHEREKAEQRKPGECWPESVMQQWDYWRKQISTGDTTSAPRDWFESLAPQAEKLDAALAQAEQRAHLIATTSALDLIQCEMERAGGPDEWTIPACQADDHLRDCIAHLVWSGEAVSWETPEGLIFVLLQDLTLSSLA